MFFLKDITIHSPSWLNPSIEVFCRSRSGIDCLHEDSRQKICSLGWLKGKYPGNPCFSHQLWGFPVYRFYLPLINPMICWSNFLLCSLVGMCKAVTLWGFTSHVMLWVRIIGVRIASFSYEFGHRRNGNDRVAAMEIVFL